MSNNPTYLQRQRHAVGEVAQSATLAVLCQHWPHDTELGDALTDLMVHMDEVGQLDELRARITDFFAVTENES